MPLLYIALHLSLSYAVFRAMRQPDRSRRYKNVLGFGVIGLAILCMVVERSPILAWSAMGLGVRDLVFLTNLTLEAAAVILAVLWQSAEGKAGKRRAVLLGVGLAGAAAWSYQWYFAPLPDGLTGAIDSTGYCKQTTEDSCSAAAAVMLLHNAGIPATEREMAELCLTRAGLGTHPLGMFRGLALKAAGGGLAPRLVTVGEPRQLAKLDTWCIISVGLRPGSSEETVQRMQEYGWQVGHYHSVVVQGGAADGSWLQVADPSYGKERWPVGHMEEIWNGQAVILRNR